MQQVKKQPPAIYQTDDSQLTEQIYKALMSFEPVPPNAIISCPADSGISYDMHFYEKGKEVFLINAEGGGCQFIHLKEGNALRSKDYFWKMVQEATEMNAKQLLGLPGSF
ncbi:hypothetical protein [Paenibacillus sp. Soil787]|uniref:hypothetical protein n=1 Tax=Paenibacillus sp. Soil787 TaxID=1736411 RepID=UPI000702AE71|nr:hypothetical protein [Paenibacillus sp. Soil787]KRF20179.1 hypothetical protein ASG93_31190 [Paenibacillus sp. Soil787]